MELNRIYNGTRPKASGSSSRFKGGGTGKGQDRDMTGVSEALKSLVVGGGGGGRESENSVCPRLLLQFPQFFQFLQSTSVRLCQDILGHVSLCWMDGTWSLTMLLLFS